MIFSYSYYCYIAHIKKKTLLVLKSLHAHKRRLIFGIAVDPSHTLTRLALYALDCISAPAFSCWEMRGNEVGMPSGCVGPNPLFTYNKRIQVQNWTCTLQFCLRPKVWFMDMRWIMVSPIY
jgi:hypothetical protein